MTKRKALSRAGLIVVIAVSLFVCPLATGGYVGAPDIAAQAQVAQFTFVPQLTPIDIEVTPVASTPGSLRPGQFFEQNDLNRPEVERIERGDNLLGYGTLKSNPDLYAIWVTDESGTHYLVVHKDSSLLWGDIDTVTNQRRANGFDKYIADREETTERLQNLNVSVNSHDRNAGRYFGIGLLVIVVGGGVCIAASLGACSPLVALGGAFIVPAFTNQGTARGLDEDIRLEEGRRENAESDLLDKVRGDSDKAGPP